MVSLKYKGIPLKNQGIEVSKKLINVTCGSYPTMLVDSKISKLSGGFICDGSYAGREHGARLFFCTDACMSVASTSDASRNNTDNSYENIQADVRIGRDTASTARNYLRYVIDQEPDDLIDAAYLAMRPIGQFLQTNVGPGKNFDQLQIPQHK